MNSMMIHRLYGRRHVIALSLLVLCFAAVGLKDNPFPMPLLLAGSLAWGFVLFAISLTRRLAALYALIAYLPFSYHFAGDFGPIPELFNLTSVLVGVLSVLLIREVRRGTISLLGESTPLNVPISIFLFLGLISIGRSLLYGFDYAGSAVLAYYQSWILPFLLFFLVFHLVRDRETVRKVVFVMMAVVTVVGLMAVYDYETSGERIGGIVDHPNRLASFFNYYMFLPLAFFLTNMKCPKYWSFLAPFLICFRGIMVTFSRGGYFAFAIALHAIVFFRSKLLFLCLVGVSVFVFMNPAFLPEGIRNRLGNTVETRLVSTGQDVGQEQRLDRSSSDRIEIWKSAALLIKDDPIFGVGFERFRSTIQHYWYARVPFDAHNTFLSIAVEMGLATLCVFIWILAVLFWCTRRLYRQTRDAFSQAVALGFLGGFFGFIVSNMYVSRLDYPEISAYFWILAALVMRLLIIEKDRISS